jgi:phosphatidylserine/phosphatidylglycerophosphate/cardiolipin synthase-like enzyme
LIVPAVDMNPNPNYNQPALQAMQNVNVNGKTVSVNSRMMPGPATAQTPYMHAKMIVVDAKTIYIGSENFTTNSLQFARELGVILSDPATAAKIKADFDADWLVSKPPTPAAPAAGSKSKKVASGPPPKKSASGPSKTAATPAARRRNQ